MYYGDVGIKKPTKRVIEEFLSFNIGVDYSILTFEKVEEKPRVWKHSCVPTGVIVLQPLRAMLFTILIEYTFCSLCGKVIYYCEECY